MYKIIKKITSLLLFCFLFSGVYAQDLNTNNISKDNNSSFESDAKEEQFLDVEDAFRLQIEVRPEVIQLNWAIEDKYFLYGEKIRVLANDQPVDLVLPEGVIAYDAAFEKDVEKHYKSLSFSIPINQFPSSDIFELTVTSQGCADAGLCYPPYTERFSVNHAAQTIEPLIGSGLVSTSEPAKTLSVKLFFIMIGSAMLGGMILNLMPCVLPVLSLKALSFANNTGSHRTQGLSYTAGVVTTFVAIAATLLLVRSAGSAVGWGFQLQSPAFITILILLFFVMGLSLSGFMNLGSRLMGVGNELTQGGSLKASYFTGVLAAVVASPCTAPFMAPALGFAITQPWFIALSIFAALGFGMAVPLLLLSYIPGLGRFLPKPGAWMETFKQIMAFPLYLTAIWLFWVLGRQLGIDVAALVLCVVLLTVFIYWLSEKRSALKPFASIMVIIIASAMSWNVSQRVPAESGIQQASVWEAYSEEKVADLLDQGKPIFINMTADWCITCLANEKLVLTKDRLQSMKEKGIHLIKGDWTNYDSKITRLLEKHNRGGVPLYLMYPAEVNAEPTLLPQILTKSGFQEHIDTLY